MAVFRWQGTGLESGIGNRNFSIFTGRGREVPVGRGSLQVGSASLALLLDATLFGPNVDPYG